MNRFVRTFSWLSLFLAASALALPAVAVPAKPLFIPTTTSSSLHQLEGMWRQIHVEFEGRDQNQNEGPTLNRWLITRDKITIITRGPTGDVNSGSWNYRFNATQNPAILDLTPENAPNTTYPCLIKLEGNRIVVCLQNHPARGRPTDLTSRPDSGIGRFIYERVP